MVPWLSVRERRSVCDYGGGVGAECRVRGDNHAVSGMQPLVEGDFCRG